MECVFHARAQDLVVGAPFYFEERVGGAIYVYMNDGGNQVRAGAIVETNSTLGVGKEDINLRMFDTNAKIKTSYSPM